MIKIVHTIEEVREQVKQWRNDGSSVGFVPTMGYLHEGHQSLIKKSVEQNDKTVVSVFVNPMQFGPTEDLDSYPRDLNADANLCDKTGADLIFNPEPEEMYKNGFCSFVDMNGPTAELCGKSRPIHFRGVCTVVSKLFNIVQPDRAYFGQKDAQQLAVIKRMALDLNIPIEIIGCPIIREEDGLAKSSRNTYLSEEERNAALILSETIFMGKNLVENGLTDAKELVRLMKENIETEPLARIDYVEVVDFNDISIKDTISDNTLVAMAVYIGKTRLIDNFIVEKNK